MRNRITIEKELIPYRFQIVLSGELFTLELKHNVYADLYTVALIKDDIIIAVEPLVYGVPLFSDLYVSGRFPAVDIVPFDESGAADSVTICNFEKTVFLTIDDEEGSS